MLYLIRHGHAVEGVIDSARELSPKGRKQVARLAEFLRASGEFDPAEFWHSPLVRARETAELLAEGLRSKAPLLEVAGLRPHDDPEAILARLPKDERSVAIVGHDPYLTGLATVLATGAPEPPIFIVRKAAVLAFSQARGFGPGGWACAWHLAPELLG